MLDSCFSVKMSAVTMWTQQAALHAAPSGMDPDERDVICIHNKHLTPRTQRQVDDEGDGSSFSSLRKDAHSSMRRQLKSTQWVFFKALMTPLLSKV